MCGRKRRVYLTYFFAFLQIFTTLYRTLSSGKYQRKLYRKYQFRTENSVKSLKNIEHVIQCVCNEIFYYGYTFDASLCSRFIK